jgi:hypothetical protein
MPYRWGELSASRPGRALPPVCVVNEDSTSTRNCRLVPEEGEVLYNDKPTSVDLFSMAFHLR